MEIPGYRYDSMPYCLECVKTLDNKFILVPIENENVIYKSIDCYKCTGKIMLPNRLGEN